MLNFGFPDIAHRSIDETSVSDITSEIEAVLVSYEPRLVAGSITVARDTSVDAKQLKIRFIVRADLFCDPVNVPVEFVADVELDSGKIMINGLLETMNREFLDLYNRELQLFTSRHASSRRSIPASPSGSAASSATGRIR